MSKAETGSRSSVLEQAARELEAAARDARVAADAAVTALRAAHSGGQHGWRVLRPRGLVSAAVRRPGQTLQRVSAARADRIRSPLNRACQEPGSHAPAPGQAACPPAGWVSSDAGQRSW